MTRDEAITYWIDRLERMIRLQERVFAAYQRRKSKLAKGNIYEP